MQLYSQMYARASLHVHACLHTAILVYLQPDARHVASRQSSWMLACGRMGMAARRNAAEALLLGIGLGATMAMIAMAMMTMSICACGASICATASTDATARADVGGKRSFSVALVAELSQPCRRLGSGCEVATGAHVLYFWTQWDGDTASGRSRCSSLVRL